MSVAELERQQLVQRLMALQNQIAYTRMAIATEREECRRRIAMMERELEQLVNEFEQVRQRLLRLGGGM
jgi:ABC-type phosphate transport system auxiliary subunit